MNRSSTLLLSVTLLLSFVATSICHGDDPAGSGNATTETRHELRIEKPAR